MVSISIIQLLQNQFFISFKEPVYLTPELKQGVFIGKRGIVIQLFLLYPVIMPTSIGTFTILAVGNSICINGNILLIRRSVYINTNGTLLSHQWRSVVSSPVYDLFFCAAAGIEQLITEITKTFSSRML